MALGAAGFVAVVFLPCALPVSAMAEDSPPAPTQELSLDGLGVGSQSVFGADGVTEVYFPSPAARLAGSGSFVRLFFAHSPNLGPGSSAVVAVNGQPLSTVPLTNGTAAGGVMEVRVAANLLSEQVFNRVEVRFTLRAAQPAPAPSDLYGRLDGQTMIHYQLAMPAGSRPAGLETYPFSLLPAEGGDRTMAVVMPSSPDAEELGTAFRLVADLGRRGGVQRPDPRLIVSGQVAWLAAGGRPALVAGRLDRLPAPDLLEAAGWRKSDRGLVGPDGRVLAADEGLVTTATSPWDHRSPLVIVTGANDGALGSAASALVGALREPVAGQSTVVSRTVAAGVRTIQSIPITLAAPRALVPGSAARYRSSVGFVAPPVDPGGGSTLELRVPSLKGSLASPTFLEAQLNGQRVGGATLDPTASQARQLRFSFPGRLLRPGANAMTLEFQLGPPGRTSGDVSGTRPLDESLTASLALPGLPSQMTDLRTLPYPFFSVGSGRSTAVVVTDGEPATLDAAARALLALGSRSADPPPHMAGAIGRSDPSHASDLVVIGAPPGSGQLAQLASSLPVQPAGADGRLQEISTSGSTPVHVLWIGGGAEGLSMAAAALADSQLNGRAAAVDPNGHVTTLAGGEEVASSAVGVTLTKLLLGAGAALLLLTLLVQMARPRRVPA